MASPRPWPPGHPSWDDTLSSRSPLTEPALTIFQFAGPGRFRSTFPQPWQVRLHPLGLAVLGLVRANYLA